MKHKQNTQNGCQIMELTAIFLYANLRMCTGNQPMAKRKKEKETYDHENISDGCGGHRSRSNRKCHRKRIIKI